MIHKLLVSLVSTCISLLSLRISLKGTKYAPQLNLSGLSRVGGHLQHHFEQSQELSVKALEGRGLLAVQLCYFASRLLGQQTI